jgi:hypothetical protein
MATLPIITGVTRVAFNWTLTPAGQTAANVMHFSQTTVSQSALLGLLNTNVTAAMWQGVSSTAKVATLTMTTLDGTSATITYATTGAGWQAGGGTGDFSPATACIVSLATNQRGRRARGRLYLPFQTESSISSGTVTGAVTPAQTAWTTFLSNMTSGGAPLVVASYGHGYHKHKNTDGSITLTPVTWPPQALPVVAATVETQLATQRRRQTRIRPGGG